MSSADRIRRFAQLRLEQQKGGKPSGLSLAEIEAKFVEKFTEKYTLTERNIQRAFKHFDRDGSGCLDVSELTHAMSLFLNGVDRARVQELVTRYDVDGDGSISLDEFSAFLLSRASPNRDEWLTVDKIQSKSSSNTYPETDADDADAHVADSEDDQPHTPEHLAKVFLSNMKALLLRRAAELKQSNKIALVDRLCQHAAPLAEATARGIVAKTFQPFQKGDSTRVDLQSFTRVLAKFVYGSAQPPRREVATLLFAQCGGSDKRGADPDRLIDLVFDQGGIRINKWGFAQPVAAAADAGRPLVGKGPIVRRSGQPPATIQDIPLRMTTTRCHAILPVPSDFDPRLLDRSTQPPSSNCVREFVYGINTSLLSGEPILYLPPNESSSSSSNSNSSSSSAASREAGPKVEIVFASAALVVIQDISVSPPHQRYFEGHDDDVTCFSVSANVSSRTCLVASGQLGHSPELLVWESALSDTISTPSPIWTAINGPGSPPRERPSRVRGRGFSPDRAGGGSSGSGSSSTRGLIARLGKGFFSRCIVGCAFSGDAQYVCAIGGDDKHDMGIWSILTGQMMVNAPTANGIPPQIKAVVWAPDSNQSTQHISSDHTGLCDTLATVGSAGNIKFWSFQRPGRGGVGAALGNRLYSIGKTKAPAARTFTCAVFVQQQYLGGRNLSTAPGIQHDLVTGGDNGWVYQWRQCQCIGAASVLPGGVCSLSSLGTKLYAAGGRGQIVILESDSLSISISVNALAGLPGQPSTLISTVKVDEGVAGAPTNRAQSAQAGQGAGSFGIFAPATASGNPKSRGVSAGGRVGASKAGGRGAGAGGRGGSSAQRPASAGWSGPGEKEDDSVSAGLSGSLKVLGLCFVPAFGAAINTTSSAAGSASGSRAGAGSSAAASRAESSSNASPTILATTGSGRLLKITIPSTRLARNAGSAIPAALPETLAMFHYGPVYAVAALNPYAGSSSSGALASAIATAAPIFASGGDDAFLCIWDSARRKQLVRTKSKTSAAIRSIGCTIAPLNLASNTSTTSFLVACGHTSGIISVYHLVPTKGSSRAAAAFSRDDDSNTLNTWTLTECGGRRDVKEDVSDVKFSPNGKLLAAGSHDNFIDIYTCSFTHPADVVSGLESTQVKVPALPCRLI